MLIGNHQNGEYTIIQMNKGKGIILLQCLMCYLKIEFVAIFNTEKKR